MEGFEPPTSRNASAPRALTAELHALEKSLDPREGRRMRQMNTTGIEPAAFRLLRPDVLPLNFAFLERTWSDVLSKTPLSGVGLSSSAGVVHEPNVDLLPCCVKRYFSFYCLDTLRVKVLDLRSCNRVFHAHQGDKSLCTRMYSLHGELHDQGPCNAGGAL